MVENKRTVFFDVNGVKVACIPNSSEMVFFGIMALAGSNYETPDIAGISHFAEHMFFKGTTSRNWRQINQEFAKMGAYFNAYTSNTEVFYHTTCPKENLHLATHLMTDLIFNSTFPEDELEKERTVIIEEKKMYEDDPDSVFETCIDDEMFVWEKGHSTIGTFETIENISKQDIMQYLRTRYSVNNILLVCCGNINPDSLKSELQKNFDELVEQNHPYLSDIPRHQVGSEFWSDKVLDNPFGFDLIVERENIQQSKIKMLVQDLSLFDPNRTTATILWNAIGGGSYSLLYSRIREELGLCYGVGTYNQKLAYPDHILLSVYGSLAPENVDLFREESEAIFKDVINNGISEDLFECAKTTSLAKVLRATETSVGRGNFLATRYLFGKEDGVEEIINSYKAVTRKDCNDIAARILDVQYNWAVMNPKVQK